MTAASDFDESDDGVLGAQWKPIRKRSTAAARYENYISFSKICESVEEQCSIDNRACSGRRCNTLQLQTYVKRERKFQSSQDTCTDHQAVDRDLDPRVVCNWCMSVLLLLISGGASRGRGALRGLELHRVCFTIE